MIDDTFTLKMVTSTVALAVLGMFGCIDHPDDFTTAPPDASGADVSPDTDCAVDEQSVCEAAGADCGTVRVVAPCMELQQIPCGSCPEGDYCGDQNECLPGRSLDGLLALYTFAEGSGDIVYDQSGDPEVELEFRGNDDQIRWVDDCDCIRFDGGKLRGDDTGGLYEHITSGPHELTMEIWMESDIYWPPHGTPARAVALSGGIGTQNFVFGTAGNDIEVRFRDDAGGVHSRQWHNDLINSLLHFAVVLTDDGQLHLYRDGKPLGSHDTLSRMNSWDESMPLLIGNEQGFERAWNGMAHLVALYDRALDESEIEHHYELGPADH